jgi:hypothetical protein
VLASDRAKGLLDPHWDGSHAMLVEGGYVHSLKTLLDKSEAEEQAFAAGRVRYFAQRLFRKHMLVEWISLLWRP